MLKEEQRSLTFTWIQLFLKFCLWVYLCPCLCLLELKKWLHLSVCFCCTWSLSYVHEFPLIRPINFYNTLFSPWHIFNRQRRLQGMTKALAKIEIVESFEMETGATGPRMAGGRWLSPSLNPFSVRSPEVPLKVPRRSFHASLSFISNEAFYSFCCHTKD